MINVKDQEQLIYELRRFADASPYLSAISKVGANEIINFVVNELNKSTVIDSVACPEWLKEDVREQVKSMWNTENNNNDNPRPQAIRLIQQEAKDAGYVITIGKAMELVWQHCL